MDSAKILVFSDSHGSTEVIKRIFESPPDRLSAVFHLGDGDEEVRRFMMLHPEYAFIGVPGNCDAQSTGSHTVFTEYGGVKIMLTHGHAYHVKLSLIPAAARASADGAKLLLYGHTHIQSDKIKETPHGAVRAINPGSVRDGYYAFITLSDGKIQCELLKYPEYPKGAGILNTKGGIQKDDD